MQLLKREYYINQIRPLIGKNIIKAITGVRRSGKSIILKLVIEELVSQGISEDNIHLIDLESEKFLRIRNYEGLVDYVYNDLGINSNERSYLFFDEIQNVVQWEKAIRAIYNDLNVDIFITGSNSDLLTSDLASHLTGRYVEIKIFPFSFKEFYHYHLINNLSCDKDDLFEEYMAYGGMPTLLEIPKISKKTVLKDIYSSIVNNDIALRNNIRNFNLFNRIFIYMQENLGSIFSAPKISKYLLNEGMRVKPETISNYILYGKNACLFFPVKLEEYSKGRKLLKSDVKVYMVDHGFRGIYFNSENGKSQILENIVFIEMLKRGYEISVGRIDGFEIDFICRKEGQIVYVQVTKHIYDQKIHEREFGQLVKIEDNYPKLVLSLDKDPESYKGVLHYNIIDFLLSDDVV